MYPKKIHQKERIFVFHKAIHRNITSEVTLGLLFFRTRLILPMEKVLQSVVYNCLSYPPLQVTWPKGTFSRTVTQRYVTTWGICSSIYVA